MYERSLTIAETKRDFQDVLGLFHQQSMTPPGNDRCIGACYQSLVSIQETDSGTRSFLNSIYQERPDITPSHFVNLFFRSIQFIKMFEEKDLGYASFHTPQMWAPTLRRLLNPGQNDQLRELLSTKDTVTTVYQRYAGPKFVISALRDGADVAVADFGCGANYGLPGIEINEPFKSVKDSTPEGRFTNLLEQQVQLAEGLAIDKQNPASPDVRNWIIACSFYPQELEQINDMRELENRLDKSSNIRFLQEDLLAPSTAITAEHFDAVILSTLLYQHSEKARCAILAEAQRVLRPDGVIIIQDFAVKDPGNKHSLQFNGAWGKEQHGYRTFVVNPNSDNGLLEVLIWADGRCRSVEPGEDFSRF